MDWKNRKYCESIDRTFEGDDVLLMGWVDAIRDHGNLLFIHLRDRSGVIQVVFDPRSPGDAFHLAETLKEEDIVQVRGKVAVRREEDRNPGITTGDIEIRAGHLEVFARSRPMPFQISEKAIVFGDELSARPEQVEEELRLKYRYLDLRRPSMQGNLVKRYLIVKSIRDALHQRDFIEIETPVLTRSTPEGARDYLVPSRVHPGRFYALPQSPQLFKQLLMVGGMDRYFQFARCFRDEDLRPNRQPEFTQLDLEAAFIDEEYIYELVEEIVVGSFRVGGIDLPLPFPRLTYREAMEKYGTDRPDVRFGMPFSDLTPVFHDTAYSIFRQVLDCGGSIKGFCIKGQAGNLSKSLLQDEYARKIVPSLGGKGMTWMKVVDQRLQSSIVQFFGSQELDALRGVFSLEEGDVVIMIADPDPDAVRGVLHKLRLHFADRLSLIPADVYCPLWVTGFPMFEESEGRIISQHHPFTMPDRFDFDPYDRLDVLGLGSRAYDLVINGEEIGGGSMRINSRALQEKIFRVLKLSGEEMEEKFGFFLSALGYGAPPHGGLALGVDRLAAMILNRPSIREVIAFPKNRSAFCPMTDSPSPVDPSQLADLGLLPGAGREIFPASDHLPRPEREPAAAGEKISPEKVRQVARLAGLKLDEQEEAAIRKDIDSILEYVKMLQNLDTEKTPPLTHVLQMANAWREDTPEGFEAPARIKAIAPDLEKDCFKVPRILEE